MAITRNSRSITLTAVNDEVTDVLRFQSLQFVGTGLTLAGRLTATDSPVGGTSSILADHYVAATSENIELLQAGPLTRRGIKLTSVPVGTFTVLALIG